MFNKPRKLRLKRPFAVIEFADTPVATFDTLITAQFILSDVPSIIIVAVVIPLTLRRADC